MIIKNAVGAAIRRLRKERNISQDILSGLADVARSHLSDIESGKKQPNLDTLCRIADALKVPPHLIIAEAEIESIQKQNDAQEEKEEIV